MASVEDRDRLCANQPSFTSLKLVLQNYANFPETTSVLRTTRCPIRDVTIVVNNVFAYRQWSRASVGRGLATNNVNDDNENGGGADGVHEVNNDAGETNNAIQTNDTIDDNNHQILEEESSFVDNAELYSKIGGPMTGPEAVMMMQQQKHLFDLFRVIGNQLSDLQSLSIYGDRFCGAVEFPTQLLTELLGGRAAQRQLQRLTLKGLELSFACFDHDDGDAQSSTSTTSFQDFVGTFHGHRSLVEVTFHRSFFRPLSIGSIPTLQQKSVILQWLESFQSIPTLQSVSIHQRKRDPKRRNAVREPIDISRSTLTDLAGFREGCGTSNANLREMAMLHFGIYDRHLECLASRMQEIFLGEQQLSLSNRGSAMEQKASTSHLQELSLSCMNLRLRGCQAIKRIIKSAPSLHTLYLEAPARRYPVPCLDKVATAILAQALTPINNHSNSNDATTTNTPPPPSQLQSFTLKGMHVDNLTVFVEMMQVNYVLETLKITTAATTTDDDDRNRQLTTKSLEEVELQCLARLNSAGRYQLMHPRHGGGDIDCHGGVSSAGEGATILRNHVDQWVDALVQVRADFRCVFYLLSANPSLCRGR